MNRFVERFTPSIVSVLVCHDRVILHGHLPFGGDKHLNCFVDYGLKIKRKDFLPFVESLSESLVEHARTLAKRGGVPYLHFECKPDKDKLVRGFLHNKPHDDGLVAVLCCKEMCRSVKLLHGQHRPTLAFRQRPQRVLYFYFLDPDFGLMHVRLQTMFPFTCQVYVNGHEWLARQMQKRRLGFVQADNAFSQLDDPAKAQQLAEQFCQLDWPGLLDRFVQSVNPLLRQPWLEGRTYRWVINQAELSTDLLFASQNALAGVYRALLEHAMLNFSADDILGFLGRRLHPRFDGEVLSDLKKGRQPGARIKHRVKNNWLKMYDKFGLILRIETVINQPREFKVRRPRLRNGRRRMVWCPMNKGVANFYRYQAVACASNTRYLDALATVVLPTATVEQLDRVQRPARFRSRRRRALNVLSAAEQRLFFAVLQGENRLNGFRNADIAHGLIALVPHSYRYHLTRRGEDLMNAAIYVRCKAFPKEFANVA